MFAPSARCVSSSLLYVTKHWRSYDVVSMYYKYEAEISASRQSCVVHAEQSMKVASLTNSCNRVVVLFSGVIRDKVGIIKINSKRVI